MKYSVTNLDSNTRREGMYNKVTRLPLRPSLLRPFTLSLPARTLNEAQEEQ